MVQPCNSKRSQGSETLFLAGYTLLKPNPDNLFNRVSPKLQKIIKAQFKMDRTYESPENNTYFMVLAPYKTFNEEESQIKIIERYLRNKYKYKRVLITREIQAKRIHYNVLMTTTSICQPLGVSVKANNHFSCFIQNCHLIKEQENVLKYITKEDRVYHKEDCFVYCK